jgi:thiosulfate/3-mercaptopyruvate sulfurtransferase
MSLASGRGVVSCDWLKAEMDREAASDVPAPQRLALLDATWFMPSDARDANDIFQRCRLPGAKRLDVDVVADTQTTTLPHMMPDDAGFAAAAQRLGLRRDDSRVVVYDAHGVFSSPRAWFMLRAFGLPAHQVAVLDGGLPRWRALGFPVETGSAPPEAARGEASGAPAPASDLDDPGANGGWRLDPDAVWSSARVLAWSRARSASRGAGSARACGGSAPPARDALVQLVDARSAARFKGKAEEPRPGMRAGHVPGALNVPFDELLVPHEGEAARLAEVDGGSARFGGLCAPDRACAVFAGAGVDVDGPVTVSCGSGMTACILALALQGARGGPPGPETGAGPALPASLYDGSWAEWGDPRTDLPVETG